MRIETRALTKTFQRTKALDAVNFAPREGEAVAVVGLNGAGKTTLLRCVSGLVAPDRGEVLFDGVPFARDQLAVRRRMIFLSDFPMLFMDRSVLRNISIILRLFEAPLDGMEEKVLALLREFDLLPLAEQAVGELSRGQAYKAALVVLLAVDPELWLLDEPFASGMDPLGLSALRTHIRAATTRGRTVIFTTQILDSATKVADRVAVLQDGALRAFDTPASLGGADGELDAFLSRLRDEG